MKSLVIAALISCALPQLAFGAFEGVAAADTAKSAADVAVSRGSTKNGAMESARAICYNFSGKGGVACKSIAAPESNSFVVIRCIDDGNHVHLAADNTAAEAEKVARANAAGFGRTNCRVIFSD